MGQDVHDMTGRSCKMCGHEFTKASMNLTLSIRRDGYIEKMRVCGKCHSETMSKGE
jgi:predicted Zn-ribbon and HTH transcriptional regulator